MHWLGPYEVKTITDGRVVQLRYLAGTDLRGMVNGSWLKLYKDSRPPTTQLKKKKNMKHEANKVKDNDHREKGNTWERPKKAG
jgi:hypothetical protein